MWGKNIKKGVTIDEKIYNTDFAATLSLLMGVNAPLDSTGKVIYSALEGIQKQTEYVTAKCYTSGTPVKATAKTTRLEIPYTSMNDGKLQLVINDKVVREVFFPETNSRTKEIKKIINITLNKEDTVKFVMIDGQNSADIQFNKINFIEVENDNISALVKMKDELLKLLNTIIEKLMNEYQR